MTRKFFGTDGIRGLTNSEPMTAETALRVFSYSMPLPRPKTKLCLAVVLTALRIDP